jgi:hypothetical protein
VDAVEGVQASWFDCFRIQSPPVHAGGLFLATVFATQLPNARLERTVRDHFNGSENLNQISQEAIKPNTAV